MKEIEVKFRVFVNDENNAEDNTAHKRLTKEFVQNRVEELGNALLEAFDETIHDVEVSEV